MSLGDNDNVTCFVMAVKIDNMAQVCGPGLRCGTGSDRHRGATVAVQNHKPFVQR